MARYLIENWTEMGTLFNIHVCLYIHHIFIGIFLSKWGGEDILGVYSWGLVKLVLEIYAFYGT